MDSHVYHGVFHQLQRLTEVAPQPTHLPAPLSLTEGEYQLKAAVAGHDWARALGLAEAMRQVPGWDTYLDACSGQPDAIWGTLGQVILARLRRIEALDAEATRLDEQAFQTVSRAARLPLVQQMEAARFLVEFMAYMQRSEEYKIVESGAYQTPGGNLLALITMEARLNDPTLYEHAADIADALFRSLQPEHLLETPII